MERRRCAGHGYRLALLTGAVVGFLMCLALVVQPPAVECRETIRFTDDAGDPDMPDRVGGGADSPSGLTVSLPGEAQPLRLEPAEKSGARGVHRELWQEYVRARRPVVRLLRLWSSVTSWLIAF
jgi:hypothetical protein